MNKTLFTLGECMLELSGDVAQGHFNCSFAGDTYNTAVYAKRWAGAGLRVAFMTAIGENHLSDAMLINWQAEQLDCSLVKRSSNAIPGVYAIHTDPDGERHFTYWRKNSAATELLVLLKEGGSQAVPHADMVFFSGISLGILDIQSREALLKLLAEKRASGVKVAFDPNYRAHLWQDMEEARDWVTRAYLVSDVALPGLEDHQTLFNHNDESEVYRDLANLGVKEVVVKCGVQGMYGFEGDGEPVHQPFQPAAQQVDSTAAGDSFAGTYLASRLSGDSVEQAMFVASDVARIVVQYPGAILAKDVYEKAVPNRQ